MLTVVFPQEAENLATSDCSEPSYNLAQQSIYISVSLVPGGALMRPGALESH